MRNITVSFLPGYLFSVVAVALAVVFSLFLYDIPKEGNHTFYGYHFGLVSVIFLIVMFGIEIVFSLGRYSLFLQTGINLIIIVLYVWLNMSLLYSKHYTGEIETVDFQKNLYINRLEERVHYAMDRTEDKDLLKRMTRLAERIHYQDPHSRPSAGSLEDEISDAAMDLVKSVENKEWERAGEIISEMDNLLAERERIVRYSKHETR